MPKSDSIHICKFLARLCQLIIPSDSTTRIRIGIRRGFWIQKSLEKFHNLISQISINEEKKEFLLYLMNSQPNI